MIPDNSLKHRGVPWTNEEIKETQTLYKEGLSVEEISKKTGRSLSAISHKLKNYDMANRRNDWTREEEQEVVSLRAKGLPFKTIGNILNRSDRSVQVKHVRLTVPQKKPIFKRKDNTDNYRRVYSVNDTYFSKIDSQKKAYYLGFITADGYVQAVSNATRGKTKRNTLGIHIAIKDLSFLEEFKRDIESNAPIKIRDAKTSIYKGREIVGTKSITLEVSSEQIVKDLSEYDIVQNKTYICKFPNKLDKEFYPGFIAGLISGDGYVGVRTNHGRSSLNLRSSLSGTEMLISRVREILIKEIGFNPKKPIYDIKCSKCLFTIEMNQDETLKMYQWMKDNGIHLLDRKNKIIEDFISQREAV